MAYRIDLSAAELAAVVGTVGARVSLDDLHHPHPLATAETKLDLALMEAEANECIPSDDLQED